MTHTLWLTPLRNDVIVCPGPVHHNHISTTSDNTINRTEKFVIARNEIDRVSQHQFDGTHSCAVTDKCIIVVCCTFLTNSLQHICTDGGIMCI